MPEAVALPGIGSVAVGGSQPETGSVARDEARQAGCSQAGHVACPEWRVGEERERVVTEAWLLLRERLLAALVARLRPG